MDVGGGPPLAEPSAYQVIRRWCDDASASSLGEKGLLKDARPSARSQTIAAALSAGKLRNYQPERPLKEGPLDGSERPCRQQQRQQEENIVLKSSAHTALHGRSQRAMSAAGRATTATGKTGVGTATNSSLMQLELTGLERRIAGQLAGLREEAAAVQRSMDAALRRLEDRFMQADLARSRQDRTMAEVSESVRFLINEVQVHGQWARILDVRFGKWRNHFQEGLRRAYADMEQLTDAGSRCSTGRSSWQQQQQQIVQRLDRLEGLVEQQQVLLPPRAAEENRKGEVVQEEDEGEEVGEEREGSKCLTAEMQLQRRLQLPEMFRETGSIGGCWAKRSTDLEYDALSWRAQHFEQQLAALRSRLEALCEEAHAEEGWSVQLREQEALLDSVRKRLGDRDEALTVLADQIRLDWDGRFEKVKTLAQATASRVADHTERIDAVETQSRRANFLLDELHASWYSRLLPTGLVAGEQEQQEEPISLQRQAHSNIARHDEQ